MSSIRSIILVAMLGVLIFVSLDTQEVAGHHETAQYYVNSGLEETGAHNIVTAIYLGYRAYDTLGEAMALFTAATGVYLLLKRKGKAT